MGFTMDMVTGNILSEDVNGVQPHENENALAPLEYQYQECLVHISECPLEPEEVAPGFIGSIDIDWLTNETE